MIVFLKRLIQTETFKIPFYRIIVAKKINEFFDRAGMEDRKIKSIPIPLKWMSTDGNIPVYLSDPYVRIMEDMGEREGVTTADFDPRSMRGEHIYLDYIHLNELGHRLLADELYRIITESSAFNVPL